MLIFDIAGRTGSLIAIRFGDFVVFIPTNRNEVLNSHVFINV